MHIAAQRVEEDSETAEEDRVVLAWGRRPLRKKAKRTFKPAEFAHFQIDDATGQQPALNQGLHPPGAPSEQPVPVALPRPLAEELLVPWPAARRASSGEERQSRCSRPFPCEALCSLGALDAVNQWAHRAAPGRTCQGLSAVIRAGGDAPRSFLNGRCPCALLRRVPSHISTFTRAADFFRGGGVSDGAG